MHSKTIMLFKKYLESASLEQAGFVDQVYKFCEDNYDCGGDNVVECMTPEEIVEEFNTIDDVKEYIGIRLEKELNCRWGGDDDKELARYRLYQERFES